MKNFEILVEWDSCESGCGTSYWYTDDLNEALNGICDELATACMVGDEIAVYMYCTETMQECEAIVTSTGWSTLYLWE